MKRTCSMIMACGYNGELGFLNDLLWELPRDMKHFVKTTRGANVFMGRKTYESLPKELAALPGRSNFVISSNPGKVKQEYDSRALENIAQLKSEQSQKVKHLFNAERSLERAITKAVSEADNPDYFDKKNIIIGGGSVYEYALSKSLVKTIHRTVVHDSFPKADVRLLNMNLEDYGFVIAKSQHFAPDDENKIGMSIEEWIHSSL